MSRMKPLAPYLLVMAAVLAGTEGFSQQQTTEYVGPGATVRGDELRGEGQYLKGLAWYELYSAQARSIEGATERANLEWLQRSYEFDQAQRTARIQRKSFRSQQAYETRLREVAKNEERWRNSPTDADIVTGDALNALLLDLSNPIIPPSSWRDARIDLAAGTSIPSLAFRFMPKLQDKGSQVLSGSLIALGCLDAKNWSSTLGGKELEKEVKAYQDLYRAVVDQSVAGRIDFKTILQMDGALAAVEAKARAEIPKERDYQAKALSSLRDVKDAAKMFDAETLDFVRELIADTSRHDAQTVGELVAFMRKYRLVFASVEKSPSGGEIYRSLYRLMREQKEKLGVESSSVIVAKDVVDHDRRVPADARPFRNNLYKVYREEMTWHEAKAKCEEYGGRLASVGGAEEGRFIAGLLNESGIDAWLGATDEEAEGDWRWVDGTMMRYTYWGPYQPNNKDKAEHYLVAVTSIVNWDGKWSDQPSRSLQHHPGFVCEWTSDAKPKASLNTDKVFCTESVWKTDNGTLTVLGREDETFRARFEMAGQIRDIVGRVQGDEIVWLAQDVTAVLGKPGDDNFGEIHGEKIDMKWGKYKGAVKGTYKFKLVPRAVVSYGN